MFRKNLLHIIILTIGIMVMNLFALSGQQKDFELWNSINLRKDIFKDLRIEAEAGYRLEENVSRTKSILGEIGFTYRLRDWVRFKLNYRVASRIEFVEHRLKGDIYFRADIKRFRLSLRNRIQREWVLNRDPKDFLRERLKLEYNIRKFPVDPFICSEAWYRFSNVENQFEQIRADIGLNWNLGKKSELDILYRMENEINVNNPDRTYILGLEFTYSFD